jgi:uncharacterized protein
VTPHRSERLIVFLKAPRVSAVKTRLGEKIGMEAACRAYCELVEALLKNMANILHVELRISPDNASDEIAGWLKPAWIVTGQGSGGLTERLVSAFEDAFNAGGERVLIIGSDCPDVTEADIYDAWELLRENDLVLGPATDGGYWLVGLSAPAPFLFEGIPWSTEKVMEKTLSLAAASDLKVKLLRTLNDVDTLADWERFQRARSD